LDRVSPYLIPGAFIIVRHNNQFLVGSNYELSLLQIYDIFFIQQKNIRFFTADKHALCDKCYVEIAKWHKGFTTA
ncbi:MAG: hypothetical protein MSS15_02600, partial [Prevotella sp.]|nr:hypothetical protein [Prevotella sp.]